MAAVQEVGGLAVPFRDGAGGAEAREPRRSDLLACCWGGASAGCVAGAAASDRLGLQVGQRQPRSARGRCTRSGGRRTSRTWWSDTPLRAWPGRGMFHRQPPPALTFVLEQMALERPIGGRQVLRRQLENLLDLGRLRTVEIQVGPQPRESRVFIDNLLGET